MDSTNTNRPVPATEEIVERLPQEVLMADSTFISALFLTRTLIPSRPSLDQGLCGV